MFFQFQAKHIYISWCTSSSRLISWLVWVQELQHQALSPQELTRWKGGKEIAFKCAEDKKMSIFLLVSNLSATHPITLCISSRAHFMRSSCLEFFIGALRGVSSTQVTKMIWGLDDFSKGNSWILESSNFETPHFGNPSFHQSSDWGRSFSVFFPNPLGIVAHHNLFGYGIPTKPTP